MGDERGIRVCVDARMLVGGGTGVSTYARSLFAGVDAAGFTPLMLAERPGMLEERGWPRLARARRWIDAARGGVRDLGLPDPAATPGIRADAPVALIAPEIFRIAHIHFAMHGRLLRLRTGLPPGIMHWTYPVPLTMVGWRNVYTVHDAIPLTRPELTPIDPRRHRRLLARISASADALVTVSAAARREIVAALGCAEGFVVDCSQPVLPAITAPAPAGFARGGYLLSVGSVEPRKNLEALAAAYRAAAVPLPLLVVGPDGWRAAEIGRRVGFGGDIRRLGYQSREALAALVAGARALLFPSLAEGFGLPVAEAMAAGTPVMTSSRGALAETAGGAALLVDPQDIGAMTRAIAALASDDALCADLAARGLERARAFTLDRFAARLATLYERLVDSRAAAPYPRDAGG